MAVKGYDVEIAGQGFNLAEDAEGDHFAITGEPLRPPNAVTVQGEQRNRFQIRPDVLLWTLTDWSGGEGQIKYSFQAPNRWRKLTGVRVFEKPGTLQPGYYVEDTQDSTGAADFALAVAMVDGPLGLMAFDKNASNRYVWDGSKWGAATAITGPVGGVERMVDADNDNYFFVENTGTDVFRYDGTTATDIGDSPIDAALLVALGTHVYTFAPTLGQVSEHNKTGTVVSTSIDADEAGDGWAMPITVLDGKVYTMVSTSAYTIVREITPTTAAGTGYGAEIARIQGFAGASMWAHTGTLYLFGRDGDRNTVIYLVPGGEYGSLGEIRPGDNLEDDTNGGLHNGRMLDHFFVVQQLSDSDARNAVFQVDAVSGGYAVVAVNEDGDINSGPEGLVAYQGDLFWSVDAPVSTKRVMRAREDRYTKASEAISPWHDFDLADEKLLSSLVLSMEALPADWQVRVDYAIDGNDSWTNVIDNTTTGSKGQTTQVSTDTSTIKFRTLSLRIRMDYTGVGVPTSGPVVLGIDVLAQVVKQQPVYRLLLDMDDDRSRTPGALSGARKFTLLKAAADAGNVVSFKDGYTDRSQIQETDVVIDQYALLFSTPGEAVASVVLREVI